MAFTPHPLDPLGPEEIRTASSIIKTSFPQGIEPNFRVVTLKEPPKSVLIPFLDSEARRQVPLSIPDRIARVHVVIESATGQNQLFEFHVDLRKHSIVYKVHLEGRHSYIDSNYMRKVEAACLANAKVQEEIKSLKLPPNATVVVEPWAYATDGTNDMSERVTMCWFYLRLLENPDANYYAYPLDVCAEVSEQLQVTKVYRLPTKKDEGIHTEPRPFDGNRIHATSTSEYHPDLRPPPRTSTKPYQVVQPEGPSFDIKGNLICWEKWRFRVGFNYREGLTLHDLRYDGRSLFYRLSLTEMFVPYGDPRAPYPRKAAFDLGNDGAGINANQLNLGCDCLGHIKYFDAWHNTSSGEPEKMSNVVCCHEQDDGILWKHTNFRTGNGVVTRSRILVLQTIITVSNYEYIFAFHFGNDASIHYEVRATGILSTCPIDLTEGKVPYGTIVAPGVLAPYHQHLFCLRIDPALDGHQNSLQVEESYAMPPSDTENAFGVGYATRSTIVDWECGLDLDINKARVFKVVNENKVNPITKTPVGFKIYPQPSQMILAHPDSYHVKRSEFAQHAIWVTNYQDDELYPAGTHTMQSLGGEGIHSAITRRAKESGGLSPVRNQDIVVWHAFGSTHNPRIEDWPVMPQERMTVSLKPVNFFIGNPGLDVQVSSQDRNNSVLVESSNENAQTCCHSRL